MQEVAIRCAMCEHLFVDDDIIRMVEGKLVCPDCYGDLPEPEAVVLHGDPVLAGVPYFCSQNHPLTNVAWEGPVRKGTCQCGRVLAWVGRARV